ncbi:extracellular solute-binding protein [Ruminococcus sp. 5_1_39BFAA]|uniref:extracellular solute-binding protein n=1 Tax=Ruminococcus sp. 5_1_39BFAA TaxID=457412 RepID=UPI003567F6A9
MKKSKLLPMLAAITAMSLGTMTVYAQTSADSEASSQESLDSNDENSGSAEEVTLNFWHHYSAQSPENETLMNVLIPKFEEENPGITVNAVSHEWADLHDKILINAKADTLPDVARLDSAWIPEFATAGILMPLEEEIADFQETADGLLDSAMSTAQIDGHSYGLALNTNTKILFYNKTALEDAGLEAPATMDEFVETAKALSGNNENGQQVWGYDEPALSGWNLCPFIWSYGGDILDPDQTTAEGYLNSEKTVAAIQMLADLYAEGAMTGFNSGDIPMTDGFGTGRYMMLLEGPWKISEMAGAYPDFAYETAAMPEGEGGSVSVLGGEDISMFTSANKEAAWKFMQFMTSEFAQVEMSKCGQIPVNEAALENETVKEADFAPFLEAIKTAKSRPTVSCWSEIDSELATAVTAVMNGEKAAQDAMDELAEKVDALLAGE